MATTRGVLSLTFRPQPQAQGGTQGKAGRRQAAGFSLLELLVVIGIIMVFLGLTIGAVMKAPRLNAAVGTQQMVSDLIRQATHAARSTGTPVVLEIYHDSPDILGISQIPIGRESFESINPPSTATDALTPASSDPAGFTGRGLRIPDCSTGGTAPMVLTALTKQGYLYRASSSGRIEGFYLTCAVRPPVPQKIGGGLYPDHILLFAVDSTDPASATDAATAGLELVTTAYTVQAPAGANPANHANNLPDPPATVQQLTYSLHGWVHTDSGMATVDTMALADDANGVDFTGTGPLGGGMWMQVGMLFDGTNLELFVDNRRYVTQAIAGAPPKTLVQGPQAGSIAVGAFVAVPGNDIDAATGQQTRDEIAIIPGSDDGTQQPAQPFRVTTGTLDEMRLDRLGVDRAARLPDGVAATGDYRVTMLPDGRVDFPAGTMTFSTPSLGTVTVNVAADGAVTSTVTP